MNGNGFWISIDNLKILGNWWMEMFSISNILLLFASFFEFFRQSEREGGFSEYDFYCIPFEIAGLLSFCLLFVFWEDEKNWCFLEFWGYLYCVIPWDLNFFRPLFSLLRFFQRMKGIGTNTLDLYATFIVRLSKMEGLNTLNFLSVFCERTFQLRITLTILIILSCVYRKIKRNEIRYKRGSSTCRGWK